MKKYLNRKKTKTGKLLGIAALALIFLIPQYSYAQTEELNAKKYWEYRERLIHDHMFGIGSAQGFSMVGRRSVKSDNCLSMGDGTVNMGLYISILATEYKLLSDNNYNTDRTLYELYYALSTLNRLDYYAETYYNDSYGNPGNPELNGFFIRTDVYPPSQQQLDYLNSSDLYTPLLCVKDDISEMSQDQVYFLLTGLRLVQEMLPVNETFNNKNFDHYGASIPDNASIHTEAIEIGKRIIEYVASSSLLVDSITTYPIDLEINQSGQSDVDTVMGIVMYGNGDTIDLGSTNALSFSFPYIVPDSLAVLLDSSFMANFWFITNPVTGMPVLRGNFAFPQAYSLGVIYHDFGGNMSSLFDQNWHSLRLAFINALAYDSPILRYLIIYKDQGLMFLQNLINARLFETSGEPEPHIRIPSSLPQGVKNQLYAIASANKPDYTTTENIHQSCAGGLFTPQNYFFDWLILINGILNERSQKVDSLAPFINAQLNVAPSGIIFSDSLQGTSSPFPWNSFNLLLAPEKTNGEETGQFNGMDYMLLYNLYSIYYGKQTYYQPYSISLRPKNIENHPYTSLNYHKYRITYLMPNIFNKSYIEGSECVSLGFNTLGGNLPDNYAATSVINKSIYEFSLKEPFNAPKPTLLKVTGNASLGESLAGSGTNSAIVNIEEGSIMEIAPYSPVIPVDSTKSPKSLFLTNNSELNIKSGGTLIIGKNAHLNLFYKAKINVESGGYLCIDSSAKVFLASANCKIIFHPGSHYGIDPRYDTLFPYAQCAHPGRIEYTGDGAIIYNCDQFANMTHPNGTNISPGSDITWTDEGYEFDGDLIIEGGAKLTINGQSFMGFSQGTGIIVQPGGQLIVDNSTISSLRYCKELFNGVTVKGNQYEEQDPGNQGSLTLKNQSVIEKAYTGISAINSYVNDPYINATGGGIVSIYESTIKNCQTAVQMLPYNPVNQAGIPLRNKSKFVQTTFINDNDWPRKNALPGDLVYLNDVHGIDFKSCSFINEMDSVPVAQRGIGIKALDASIKVVSACKPNSMPCVTEGNNHFKGLRYGVRASMISSNKQIEIDDAHFEDNYHAVHLINSNQATVTRCQIMVPAYEAAMQPMLPYGIHLDGGRNFKVQENNLITFGAFNATLGIVADNTGALENQIYKNEFEGFNAGIEALDTNRGPNGEGLRLICNRNNNPAYDIWITNGGISVAQLVTDGVTDYPAGNVFSSNNRQFDWDFSNGQAQTLDYYYLVNSPEKEKPVYHSGITTVTRDFPNQCPSKLDTKASLSQHFQSLGAAQVSLNSSTTMLNIWENGGDANLEEQVICTEPWEAYVEFNNLLSESPYISDEVLAEVLKNPSFTDQMVKLLFVANPHAARNEDLMAFIWDARPTFPLSYYTEIKQGEETSSQLQLLRNDVATDKAYISEIEADIEAYYRRDTVNAWAQDSLMALLSRKPGVQSRFSLAAEWLSKGEFAEMEAVLNSIESDFELSPQEATQYANYLSLFNIAQSMMENEGYTASLNEEHRQILTTMVEKDQPRTSALATAILMRDEPNLDYQEEVVIPTSSPARKAPLNLSDKTEVNQMQVYPNPAYDFATLKLKLEGDYTELELRIFDESGRLVLSKQLNESQGETLLDLSSLAIGHYQIVLFGNQEQIELQKLTIVK